MPNTKANTKAATRTKATADTGNPLTYYADKLKAWPTKYAGAKPTAEQFKAAHALGAKPGTKTAMAVAMYLRPGGATQGQVFNINGGPYLNKMRAIIEAGAAKREPMPQTAEGHTVYKLALAKPKAKATRKPKAAKPKADKPATAEPATAEPAAS